MKSALSLIEYDLELKPAMVWVFGDSLICPNLTICKKVAFHPKIMKRCITLDGDVVSPHGVLSGGSAVKVFYISLMFLIDEAFLMWVFRRVDRFY